MKLPIVLFFVMSVIANFVSEGKHVFSFIDSNRDSSSYAQISIRCVSNDREVDGLLTIPLLEKYYEFNATSLQAATIEVNYEAIPSGTGLQSTTVIIEAENDDVDLVVYAHSYTSERESFMVLPSDALGQLYYVMSYKSTQGNGVFSISPVDLDTDVEIYFSEDFSFGGEIYNMNNPYRATLNQRSLHFQTSFDPTGTRIEANKKLQVVSGNDCAGIPSSTSYCNHISEALPPVVAWGSNYAVAPFHERNSGYLLRILAAEDNTDVLIQLLDRIETVTLDRGAMKETFVTLPVVLTITANHPVLVVQFMQNSVGTDTDNGSPAMVVVPAIEHSIPRYLPFTSLPGFTSSHVTTWLSSLDVDGLRIDGSPLTWDFVGPAFGGAIAQTTVSPGEHHLSHISPSVRLCGLAYGYGSYVSYAHPMYFHPLTATNDEMSTSPPVIEDCPQDKIVDCPSHSHVAVVAWTPPTARSSSSLLPITSNYQSGDSFKIGTTEVMYQFSDVFGNVAVCSFEVLVQDVSPPEIFDCPSDFNLTVCDTSPAMNWPEPYAIDNSLDNYHAMQSSHTTTDGTEIRYDFWDNSGNEATCSFKIDISHPNDCKVAVNRSSLETAAISLGLGSVVMLMFLCSLIIWNSFNKYVKEKALPHKSRGNESRNYYKNNPTADKESPEPKRDSLYLRPRTLGD